MRRAYTLIRVLLLALAGTATAISLIVCTVAAAALIVYLISLLGP